MHRFQQPSLRTFLALTTAAALTACAGDAGYDASGGGGGNVGFGGAQDIGEFRAILERGEIPAPETLDANGFFNEHYTELPDADCGLPLCLHGMVSVNRSWLDGSYQASLRVALNSELDPATFEGKPKDLVLVVDVSGSMAAENRLSYVKDGIQTLIQNLGDEDRLGLVTYSSSAIRRAGLGEQSPEELSSTVAALQPGGSTNIHAGLSVGMQMLSEELNPEREARVILLSDGLITAGAGAPEVISLAENFVSDGIGISSIGVGTDFNVELMRGLSERGAGNFYYLESAEAIAEVFQEELEFFTQPIAYDLQVAVESDPSHRLGEVLGTRLWQTEVSGGSMSVPALFLSSRTSAEPGETGRRGGGSSLFIEMTPQQGQFETDAMATVRASYRLPDSGEIVSQEIRVDNPIRGEIPDAGYVSHEQMLKGYAMLNIFLGLRETAELAQYDYHCAAKTAGDLRSKTADWNLRQEDADFEADLALLDMFVGNLEAAGGDAELCGELYYGDDVYEYRHCTIGTGRDGLAGGLLLLMALGLASRRRSTEG